MTHGKCPFCGAEHDDESIFNSKWMCGSWMDNQSDYCKLIVANRELEEKHRRLVEAAKTVLDRVAREECECPCCDKNEGKNFDEHLSACPVGILRKELEL